MFTESIGILAIVTSVIWIFISRELSKFSDVKNGRKIVTLMTAGTLFTAILTISLFQNLLF
ncbi:hypothetical protein A1A1_07494 [Planococcus antarcticus DSM 14505]|uniref:Uncharacterized protein n=1 Tax=Planococcus antarcticus DSM 14505 TaxID=1185653 RepID=A0A1C7DI24_9BACL|nr:hypothetical protein [Planococcus antarcticus]ANU11052.1 hypothetical protein BBH88_12460 [Planococcus antarcticus DSM 14505]EIM07007.1 hypothetical protein A1A1_07494 [Planococcus antarcticus DSM 14505]